MTSEEPGIRFFEPRTIDYRLGEPATVWAIDEFHAPHYFFPRNCPRVCLWSTEDTTVDDVDRFFGHSDVGHIIAMESCWLARIREANLYRYTLAPDPFSLRSFLELADLGLEVGKCSPLLMRYLNKPHTLHNIPSSRNCGILSTALFPGR
ncbi:MAG: hypothetical protein Q8P50_00320 [Bacillota bacterium]|nr:hypothetical protein [Bacillota bacterium]